jgi:ATP-dependent Clp protease ATP-binding subunit ClpA
MIEDLNHTLAAHGLQLVPAPGVAEFLVDACCTDPAYGARPLRRGVQRHIEDPLAEWMLLNEAREGNDITLEVRGDRLELGQPVPAPISG